jgi:hypothetical protein
MEGLVMSSSNIPNKYSGAPGAKKPAEDKSFDLFRTFRHPPKPAEPLRPQKKDHKKD